MENYKKYHALLSLLLNNAQDLNNTALCLLKNTPIPNEKNPKPNQALATHSQHFIYLALEEIGKFFMILNQYDAPLDNLDLKGLGWGVHNKKITYFINHFVKILEENNKKPSWEIDDAVEKLRGFKEANIYIDYKSGQIIKPVVNRGNNSIVNLTKLLMHGMKMAKLELFLFEKKNSK